MRSSFKKPFAAAAAAIAATFVSPVWADVVLKVVPHADLKILDPVWTTAFVTHHYGYMI